MSLPASVRAARSADLRPVSRVLARAFRDDPVHRWMLPSEFDWALFSAGIFAGVVAESLRQQSAATTEALEGAACWFPPYPAPAAAWSRLVASLRSLVAMGRRAGAVGRQLDRLHRARPLEPHWYLAVLGTDPRHQGRGVGSALLAPVLERCDSEGLPAYLESSKPENVPFYQRHGFQVVGELDFEDGPRLWRMQRAAGG